MTYYNGNNNTHGGNYNNNNGYSQNSYGQHQEAEFDDYYSQNNASTQWDSRSAKSSHTMHSNYSSQPFTKEQPPMPAPYGSNPVVDYPPTANPVVDYPPTHRVQFPGGFAGPQRSHTGDTAGFSSAREKLMKRRVSLIFLYDLQYLFICFPRWFHFC
jgi:hypothetical protein